MPSRSPVGSLARVALSSSRDLAPPASLSEALANTDVGLMTPPPGIRSETRYNRIPVRGDGDAMAAGAGARVRAVVGCSGGFRLCRERRRPSVVLCPPPRRHGTGALTQAHAINARPGHSSSAPAAACLPGWYPTLAPSVTPSVLGGAALPIAGAPTSTAEPSSTKRSSSGVASRAQRAPRLYAPELAVFFVLAATLRSTRHEPFPAEGWTDNAVAQRFACHEAVCKHCRLLHRDPPLLHRANLPLTDI